MMRDDDLGTEFDGPNTRRWAPAANGHDTDDDPPPLPFTLLQWDARASFAGEAPRQRWLVSHVIPRGVAGLIASAGDLGKSFLCLELCLRTTRGPLGGTSLESPLLGGLMGSHGAAVFVTAEDGRGSVHRRLRALDPDGERQANRAHPLYLVPLPDAGGPFPIVVDERGRAMLTDQFMALRDQLRAIPDLALVVLDPLQCFVHADVNADPQAAAVVMAALNMLAAETGASVLATHHVRKEKEAPRNSQEARHLIRGTSALVDQSRVAIVLWPPDELEARSVCRKLGASYTPNAIVHGAVVKSNDGSDRSTWTLLRGPTGMLRDVTHAIKARGGSREEHLAAMVGAVTGAAEDGKPYTRTGINGLYERRAELGEALADMPRAALWALADELLKSGRIVQANAGGTSVKWLDIPAGPFARGQGGFAAGARKAGGAPS